MPKLDVDAVPQINATGYPSPWREEMARRHYRRLGPVSGLSDFGVSHVTLEPGGVSSQRHWHEGEDEFLVMLEGEAILIEDKGESLLRAGDCAAFPKSVANGHHLANRTASSCTFIVVGRPATTDCHYRIRFPSRRQRTFNRKNGQTTMRPSHMLDPQVPPGPPRYTRASSYDRGRFPLAAAKRGPAPIGQKGLTRCEMMRPRRNRKEIGPRRLRHADCAIIRD